MNEGTQKYINFDLNGTVNTQVVGIGYGTVTTIGSISSIGTLPTITIGESTGGTLDLVSRVGNIGTLEMGTITAIPNIPGGTIGVVSNITNGSIVVTNGTIAPHAITAATITEGTLRNLISGTINSATVTGTIDTTSNAVVSTVNSTTVTLAAGGTWTGGTTDLLQYNTVRLSAYSDVDSAANGLKLRFSNDGTNWDITRQTTLSGSLGVYAAFNRVARYVSPQYINGAGSQGVFRLQTILTPNSPEFTRRFLSEVPVSSNAGIITQSNIFGTSTAGGGAFVQVKVSPSGAIQVGGAINMTTGTLTTGSLSNIAMLNAGTITRVEGGSIVVTAGTIAAHAITAATITEGTLRNLISGTINSATVVLNSGTINVSTATVGTIPGIGTVTNIGTLGTVTGMGVLGSVTGVGVVTTVTNLSNGTIQSSGTTTGVGTVTNIGTLGTVTGVGVVTTLTNLSNGTIQSSGTTTGVGVVSMLTAGTVSMINAGTLTSLGTIPGIGTITNIGSISTIGTMPAISSNPSSGTLDLLKLGTVVISSILSGSINVGTMVAGTLNTGTINTGTIDLLKAGTITKLEGGTLGVLTAGTINSATAVLNSGTINVATAVITTLPNLPQGSINVTAGTFVMTNGTIGAGTVRINPNPTIHWMPFGTTTTGTIGTLVAAPSAGSSILLNSLDISVQSGTAEVLVSYGLLTTGTGVVSRGNYVAGGGIAKTYTPPIGGSIAGSALTYNILSGAGTVSYNIGYAVQVP